MSKFNLYVSTYQNQHMCYGSNTFDEIYQRMLIVPMTFGEEFEGRNGVTKRLTVLSITCDISEGHFPLTGLRKMPWGNIQKEFMFDIGYNSNVEALGSAKHFWSHYADADGELGGSCYNRYWRRYPVNLQEDSIPNEHFYKVKALDQIEYAIETLIKSPDSRRVVISTWNPSINWEENSNGCPPCHIGMTLTPGSMGWLDMTVVGRSWDLAVGASLDLPRYAMMLEYIARRCGKWARHLTINASNAHVYRINYDEAWEMSMERKPTTTPILEMELLEDEKGKLTIPSFSLENYSPLSAIKMEVA